MGASVVPSPASTPAAVHTNSVTIKNMAFNPATITVKAGTTVTWINRDHEAHTVSFPSTNPRVTSKPLQTNEGFRYTFQTPGTYAYVCLTHPSMQGRVIVTRG
jgi:plastocyanin